MTSKQKYEQRIYRKMLTMIGNDFDAAAVASKVKRQLGGKTAECLYFGFNPVTYSAEIVLLTEGEYIFVPLDERPTLAGGAWSSTTFLILYYAQERLSAFLTCLGSLLGIPAIDRCLYGAYLEHQIFYEEIDPEPQEYMDFCLEKQNLFRSRYQSQLEEKAQYPDWISYHNHGFMFRYIPSMEIQNAIDAIYAQEKVLAENNYWHQAKAAIRQLRDLAYRV